MTLDNKADSFLRLIRRAQRGRLKVYLGYAAGVGKTYQMLLEGRRLKEEGIDVAVGLVETHGRVETEKLLGGLEVIPRRSQQYRGIVVEEMDMEAILARKPEVVLIDELAHSNVPGSRNDKRYQDVQDVVAAGIHVITTLNVQHLESLYDTVEKALGVKIRERLPDSVIAEADQIVNVDVSTEDLRKRLKEGKVYTPERVEVALDHFFKEPNLDTLRELTLRELASQIDLRRRDSAGQEEEGSVSPDQVMVCLSSRGPNAEKLLRYTSRLAGRLNRNWYAVYVQTPLEDPLVIDSQTQDRILNTLTLAKQLGAIVFTYKGEDIVRTLLQFAKEYRVGHVVIGSPTPRSLWDSLRGKTSVVDRLIHEAKGVNVTVLDTREEHLAGTLPLVQKKEPEAPLASIPQREDRWILSRLVSSDRIIIWNNPVTKREVLQRLCKTTGNGANEPGKILDAILKREEQGSTFFNEGAAFPHARIDGLEHSMVSLGLVRQGVSDELTERPVDLVFLILTPADNPDEQIRILALASRASQSRQLIQSLRMALTAQDVMNAIREWETPDDSTRSNL
jgi:two-component system, OmpR family, sensor histidine kinase KdpD